MCSFDDSFIDLVYFITQFEPVIGDSLTHSYCFIDFDK